jgi:hypothetical protein
MTYRYVTGTIKNTNSVPWVGVVYFTLVNRSYTTSAQYPSSTQAVTLDETGSFRELLWCNEEGEKASYYIVRLPDSSTFNFTLPVGTSDIDLSLLEIGGINPQEPQYVTLLTFLEAYINAQIGQSGAGVISNQFSFGDASPKILAPNFTGNIRTAGLIIQTPFNVNSRIGIGTPTQPYLLFDSLVPLTEIGTFEQYPSVRLSVAVNIVATIQPGFGSTQGSGAIFLEI